MHFKVTTELQFNFHFFYFIMTLLKLYFNQTSSEQRTKDAQLHRNVIL